jgi:hypothetical protein
MISSHHSSLMPIAIGPTQLSSSVAPLKMRILDIVTICYSKYGRGQTNVDYNE